MSDVVSMASEAISSGAFDEQIEGIIIQTARSGPDTGLTEIGFIIQMALRLMDRSQPTISFTRSKQIASGAYRDFLTSEKIEFGDAGYDWSGGGARTLADEFEADYWEPTP